MAKQIANPTKAQIAENVKAATKEKIRAAKASIEDSKKRIDKAKDDIKAAKNNIKSQKALIKAAKAEAKNAKVEAQAEAATQKAAKKAEKAAKKASKAAEKVADDSHRGSPVDDRLGKFIIKKAADDSFMFNLCDADGKIIATSQMYSSLDSCMNGIRSVSTNAPDSPVEDQTAEGYYTVLPCPKFELYIDKGGNDYRFRLKARNSQNIVASPAFKTKGDCLSGINNVKHHSKTKIIDEE